MAKCSQLKRIPQFMFCVAKLICAACESPAGEDIWERCGQMADENDRRPPEMRSHEGPWYDKAAGDLSEKMGDTPESMRWAKKLTGPENPLNAPAWITEGVDHMRTGWKTGDYPRMGFGALETGAGALPFAGGAASVFQRLARQSAARRAAEAAKGPWGNPEYHDRWLNEQPPQLVRNPINATVEKAREIDAFNNEGLPHNGFGGPLTDAQKAENFAKTQQLDQRRRNYDEFAGQPYAYGRDLHNSRPVQQRPMTTEELRSQYRKMLDDADALMRREKQADVQYDPMDGNWYGVEGKEAKKGNRVWYPDDPLDTYADAQRQRQHYYGSYTPDIPTPEKALADRLTEFGGNNEHNPYLMQQADALADRVGGINAQQKPHWDRISREQDAWNKVLFGGRYVGEDGIQYHKDVDKFMRDAQQAGRPYNVPKGHDPEMDIQEFKQLLALDPRARHVADNPQLAKQIYDDFWKEEYKALAEGRPTNHDLYMHQQKMKERQAIREMGLDPDKSTPEEIKAAWDERLAELRGDITEQKKRLGLIPNDDKFLDAVFPEHADRIRALGANAFKYGPPTAVGAYAANKVLNWPEAQRINPTDSRPITPAPERDPAAPRAAPIKHDAIGLPSETGPDDYLKYAVQKGYDKADSDDTWAKFRMGVHGGFGLPTAALMPGWPAKIGSALFNTWMLGSAIKDKQKAQSDMETYDAQKKGYVDQLPNLKRDEYLD